MLKKRLLPLVLCLALLIPLAACQGGGYKEIEPPVEKLNWGMTQEEALKALSLEDDEIYKNNSDGTSWDLTYEQAGMGDSVAGLTLSTTPNHSTGVNLLFNTYDGTPRLTTVILSVHASGGKEVEEKLTEAYGKPTGPFPVLWISVDPNKAASESDFEKVDEYTRGTILQASNGELKLYALRPTLYAQGYGTDSWNANQEGDFTLRFSAESYLLTQYGDGS